MTNEELALIEGIREEPWDDTRRLVYADWLEEHGQEELAELIRLQIEEEENDDFSSAQRNRINELLAVEILNAQLTTWPQGLKKYGIEFRRGMGEAIWNSIDEFCAGSEALENADNPPWIVERELSLFAKPEEPLNLVRLVASDGYRHLTRLKLRFTDSITISPICFCKKGESPSKLLELTINGKYLSTDGVMAFLTSDGVTALATSPEMKRLRKLDLSNCAFSSDAFQALANSTTLENLARLDLARAVAGPEAVDALTRAMGLPGLRSLDLSDNNFGVAQLRRLLTSPWIPRLNELSLSGNPIRDGGAKAIASCQALANLRELNLNGTQITDVGAAALLDSPHLSKLTALRLVHCPKLTDAMKTRLRNRFRKGLYV